MSSNFVKNVHIGCYKALMQTAKLIMSRSWGRGVEKGADPASLLDLSDIESLAVIQQLERQFSSMLPPRFGNIRASISPTPKLYSVIRAYCQNKDCGARAIIHINRVGGMWQFLDDSPKFDRLQNAACDDCIQIFSKTFTKSEIGLEVE